MTRPLVTVAKNIVALVLREGSSKGIYFLLSMIIARRYGKELLGQYVLAFLFPRLFFIVSEMGLNTFLTREVAKAKALLSTYVVNLAALKTLLGGVALLATCIAARLLYSSGTLFRLICLSGFSYFLINYLYLLNSAFRAFEKMDREAKLLILRDLLFLAGALFWIWTPQGLSRLFLFFFFSNAMALVYGLYLYRQTLGTPVARVSLSFCRKALGGAKPIWFISLFSILYIYVDSILLSVLKTEADVGLYNASFMFVELFILFSTILTTAFFPLFSRVAENRAEFQKTYAAVLKLALFCFLPLQLCLLVFADRWLVLFFGPSFVEGALALRILMSVGFLFSLGSVNAYCLMAAGEERFVAKAMGFFLILNIALNLWWIPSLGIVGCSLATVLCEVLVFSLFFRRIRLRTEKGALL